MWGGGCCPEGLPAASAWVTLSRKHNGIFIIKGKHRTSGFLSSWLGAAHQGLEGACCPGDTHRPPLSALFPAPPSAPGSGTQQGLQSPEAGLSRWKTEVCKLKSFPTPSGAGRDGASEATGGHWDQQERGSSRERRVLCHARSSRPVLCPGCLLPPLVLQQLDAVHPGLTQTQAVS